MTDRRRVNGPAGGTAPPVFAQSVTNSQSTKLSRARAPNQIRKIFLKTGLTPSASGSAYLELEPSPRTSAGLRKLSDSTSTLKLTCTVHGPRPLPRSAPFTPQLLLSTHVKFAPFASQQRRGYVRDANERDLAVHLETALRGVLIGERWPKSGVDVVITVLEGEEDLQRDKIAVQPGNEPNESRGWGTMSILSGCITVASAAIADAGIDCVDIVTGGMAATTGLPTNSKQKEKSRVSLDQLKAQNHVFMDPCPTEHNDVAATCVVGYLQSRDEVTEVWVKGNVFGGDDCEADDSSALDVLLDGAVEAARAARLVVIEAIKESTIIRIRNSSLIQT